MKDRQRPVYLNSNLHIIFTVTLIAVMGVSSITPAFPRISDELGMSSKEVNMLIVFFTMPGIFLSPFLGILADRFGRKKVLVPSLLVFALCGTACAFVNDFTTLLVLRFFQGSGAASLSSLNQTIIGDLFPGEERVSAMGLNSTILSLGTMIYPSIGGAIALLGWHYPFMLSALALPVAILVIAGLKNPEPEKNGNMSDYLKSSYAIIVKKELLALYFATFSAFVLLYGVMLAFFPYFMKDIFNATPLEIGLITSTASIGSILGSVNLGRLSAHFSSKKLMITGFFLYILSLNISSMNGHMAFFIIAVFLFGFANGILIPNIQTQISIISPAENRGAVMSFNSTVLRLGQTAGPFLSGIILTTYGSRGIFISGTVFAIATILILQTAVHKHSGRI